MSFWIVNFGFSVFILPKSLLGVSYFLGLESPTSSTFATVLLFWVRKPKFLFSVMWWIAAIDISEFWTELSRYKALSFRFSSLSCFMRWCYSLSFFMSCICFSFCMRIAFFIASSCNFKKLNSDLIWESSDGLDVLGLLGPKNSTPNEASFSIRLPPAFYEKFLIESSFPSKSIFLSDTSNLSDITSASSVC